MTQEKHYKVCFNCGNFVHESEKDNYCSLCGNIYEIKCPDCHEKIHNPIARFCPNCGTPYLYKFSKSKKDHS